MEWTKDLPVKGGYYWWRRYKWKAIAVYFVFGEVDKDGEWWCRWCHEGLYDKQKVEEVGGEWMGPIEPPLD